KMPAFEWVHVQLHQQKGMISLSPPTICNSADNPLAIPLSAVVGIPLYIRAEAVIPLASVLMTKGMGLGALMALIIGSAGASLTEVILLKSMFRMPMIVAFLTVILGMAILMGYLTQLLF
ncbi:permease, partial [Klebsiella pneumoniae]